MRISDKMPEGRSRRASAGRPRGTETEIKLPVADIRAVRRQLLRLRAERGGRVHEMNTLYDTPDRALAREGKMLRIRVERPARVTASWPKPVRRNSAQPAALLTFKGPPHSENATDRRRYKVREEREVRVADAEALARILEGLGLRPCFRYEKYRSIFRLPHVAGVTLDLDETPIGDFLEVEGACAKIDHVARLLGYRRADYIAKSYGALFLERTRGARHFGDSQNEPMPASGLGGMLFDKGK
jgi:adenylate cyclase class 2